MNMRAMQSAFGIASRKSILGIPVASLGRDEAVGLLKQMLAERRFTKVSFLNAHNANIASRDAEFAAEPVADVGVKATGCGLLPGHCHVTDREHDQHDRRELKGGRRAGALPEAHHDGRVEQHGRDRGRPGHGQE